MINPSETSLVFFLCAPSYATGGTELAHQAACQLREVGFNAKMLYMPTKENPVHERFEQYGVPWTFELEDQPGVTIILPETSLGYACEIKRARVLAWWMSVDNFLTYASVCDLIKNRRWGRIAASFKRSIREIIGMRSVDLYSNRRISLSADSNRFNLHLYQSEYAKNFLSAYGIGEVSKLSDYINDYYLSLDLNQSRQRKSIVLYNPSKGFETTKLVIDQLANVEFVPLAGLSLVEMRDLLATAKVYIDFGNHPGKDRIPREAAASGCIIITNKRGSAANSEDIPIPDEFKIGSKPDFLNVAVSVISYNLANYDSQLQKQDSYRVRILEEKKLFKEDLMMIFRD